MKFSLAFLITLFVTSAHVLFATVTMAPGDGSIVLPPLTGNISIQGRQLLVDGAPFVMKGICYEPMRPGQTIPDGIMTLKPTDTDLVVIKKDFQMMQAAGINTIRTYEPITDPRILALLTKYHLHTIVPICPSEAFYQDPQSIAQTVEILKNEPSTLIFEIENEWNLNRFYTMSVLPTSSSASPEASQQALSREDWNLNNLLYAITDPPASPIISPSPSQPISQSPIPYQPVLGGLSNQECLQLIQSVAVLIRSIDTTHPISTNIIFPTKMADPLFFAPNVYTTLPDFVDLFGVNFYNGLSFGSDFFNPEDTSAFTLWQATCDKPFYLGEYGADAWNSITHTYDPADQAMAAHDLTTEVLNNLSASNPDNILVGGCLFEFCDEWWKARTVDSSIHGIGGVSISPEGPWPDHAHNPAWFGIVDVNRKPRPAYWALKKLFTE